MVTDSMLDTKSASAVLCLTCQQGRKRTTGSRPPSLQAWKLINNELGKVITEVTINYFNKPPEAAARNCKMCSFFIGL